MFPHARPARFLALALALAGLVPGRAQAFDPAPALQPPTLRTPTLRPVILPTQLNDPATWSTFNQCMELLEGWIGRKLPDWLIHSAVFGYPTRRPLYDREGNPRLDPQGRQLTTPVTQSGRVFFPPAWRVKGRLSLPLVLYPHATMLGKSHVPSQFGGHEWLLGAAAALYYGWAVVMPDQPGMGGDATSYHTFCHARSLAYSLVDALPAVAGLVRTDPYLSQRGYQWNGSLYLVGYSEGAYAALAAARELETHPADESTFTLKGSVCMAGPFDLSGTIRSMVIAKDRPYAHPFFIPYVIRAYASIYGDLLDPAQVFAPVLLETREDGNLLQWTDGCRDGLQVDALIGRRLGVPGDQVVLRDLFNPDWVARELDDPGYATSQVHKLLLENDLCGGWRPTRPILFGQSPADRDVPIKNTLRTMAELGEDIRRAGDDPARLLAFLPIGKAEDGVGHVEGTLVAIPAAFNWIYSGLPMK
jgi:hypothetical protein